jgi:hypothetical protein
MNNNYRVVPVPAGFEAYSLIYKSRSSNSRCSYLSIKKPFTLGV